MLLSGGLFIFKGNFLRRMANIYDIKGLVVLLASEEGHK
jgi:hypothetical protein